MLDPKPNIMTQTDDICSSASYSVILWICEFPSYFFLKHGILLDYILYSRSHPNHPLGIYTLTFIFSLVFRHSSLE